MRRLSGVVLAGAILMLPAFSQNAGVQAQAPQKFTMEGDLALWSVAIRRTRPPTTSRSSARCKEALTKSEAPEAKQQLAGWKVVKDVEADCRTATSIYIAHHQPGAGADYNILQVLYAVFTDPTEQKALYDLYRGALGGEPRHHHRHGRRRPVEVARPAGPVGSSHERPTPFVALGVSGGPRG